MEWFRKEPNNLKDEHCVEIKERSIFWRNQNCDKRRAWICEKSKRVTKWTTYTKIFQKTKGITVYWYNGMLHVQCTLVKIFTFSPTKTVSVFQRFTDEESKAFSSPTNPYLHEKSVDDMSLHEWERFPLFGPTYVIRRGMDRAAALSD